MNIGDPRDDGNSEVKSGSGSQNYQDTIKRPAVDAEVYIKAEKACIGNDMKPNRLIQNTFDTLFKQSGEPIDGLLRLNRFAEQNEMEMEEAFNLLMSTVLDDSGNVEKQFRKPFFFDSKYWQ